MKRYALVWCIPLDKYWNFERRRHYQQWQLWSAVLAGTLAGKCTVVWLDVIGRGMCGLAEWETGFVSGEYAGMLVVTKYFYERERWNRWVQTQWANTWLGCRHQIQVWRSPPNDLIQLSSHRPHNLNGPTFYESHISEMHLIYLSTHFFNFICDKRPITIKKA